MPLTPDNILFETWTTGKKVYDTRLIANGNILKHNVSVLELKNIEQ